MNTHSLESLQQQIKVYHNKIDQQIETVTNSQKKGSKDHVKNTLLLIKEESGILTEIYNRLVELAEKAEVKSKALPIIPQANKYLVERKILCAVTSYFTIEYFQGIILNSLHSSLESHKTNIALGICVYLLLEKITEPVTKIFSALLSKIVALGGDFLKACKKLIEENFMKFLTLVRTIATFLIHQVINLAEAMAQLEWGFLMLITKRIVTIPTLLLGLLHYLKPDLGTATVLNKIMTFIYDNQIDESFKSIASHPYAPIGLYIVIGLLALGAFKASINQFTTEDALKNSESSS